MNRTGHTLSGKKVIVTGAGGFIGGAVMAALAAADALPVGMGRQGAPDNLQAASAWVRADLVADPLDMLLADIRPDAIIHCAALTAAPETDTGRAELFAANLTATVRLIDAVSRLHHPVRLVVVSSAAIWAPMPPGLPMIDETFPMRPVAAYGVSKAAATLYALAEADRHGLDLAVAVPFNVLGPGQPRRLVPSVFIDQLNTDTGQFTVSNPDVIRDWVDVRDVANALVTLSQPNGPRGLFNIASGKGHSLAEMIAALCRIGGWTPKVQSGAPHNASGVNKSVGDPRRLTTATGWLPQIALDTSLRDMIRSVRG
ncbi:MAG: NAD-dependent epimerase/dehydratase family protein [Paracoccaceae bacterium]